MINRRSHAADGGDAAAATTAKIERRRNRRAVIRGPLDRAGISFSQRRYYDAVVAVGCVAGLTVLIVLAFAFSVGGDVAVVADESERTRGIVRRRDAERKVATTTTTTTDDDSFRGHPVDRVATFLLGLARSPPSDLRAAFADARTDPFRLEDLRTGSCPDGDAMEWLPARPPSSARTFDWFRRRNDRGGHDDLARPVVGVYYEHLSKAGGTSFCELARDNMPKREVPDYYCMPSEPGKIDARVGTWTKEKLANYFRTKPHRLVSNEWEPFQLDFLDLRRTEETLGPDELTLLFVTSLRDPINRLLSAHKFWGVLNNPSKNKPSLETYLQRRAQAARRWTIGSSDFNGNVGRFNFFTWKFSGGALPVNPQQLEAERLLSAAAAGLDVDLSPPPVDWPGPFQTAVRTLAAFDLAIPIESMSADHGPVEEALGWTDFTKEHVVNMGQVRNNDASNTLPPAEYHALWDANALDVILWRWTSAVYTARSNGCG